MSVGTNIAALYLWQFSFFYECKLVIIFFDCCNDHDYNGKKWGKKNLKNRRANIWGVSTISLELYITFKSGEGF
jgi:hypothetical protein